MKRNLKGEFERAETGLLDAQVSRAFWKPVSLSRETRQDFHDFCVSLLLPGLSNTFHQQVLGRSYTTVRGYRAMAREEAERHPELWRDAESVVRKLTSADGLLMAQLRGRSQLPFWSKLAIVEYRKRGHSISELAGSFKCSRRTIHNVIRSGNFLSCQRTLPPNKLSPPNKFRAPADQSMIK